ncbi:tetratricopeptide repeat protein [Pantanalinema sp. GBBB05]|uniref:tetratricopeptide repeat protein n=1 Tax=Pantanalinema sp. GBBB05 TaxID=2604139 RepID=UPI001D602888|nr:tetratricopeptide repeat protein [Pantanalinema sp. GBBB05]
MRETFPLIYLSLLLVLLGLAAWAIVRQVLRTRSTETRLTKLQSKLTKEKGTAQEYYELGSIYLQKKVFAQAITLYQKALKAEEELPEQEGALIYNALGYAYFGQEQYDLAIRQYKEALKLNPQYVVALNNLGHAYERKQLSSQALEAYEQALQIEPQNITAKQRAESLRKRLVPSA